MELVTVISVNEQHISNMRSSYKPSVGILKGPVADFCEHSNEQPGSIKEGEFLNLLSNYQFSRRGPVSVELGVILAVFV
jgi:hypothetical protein